MPMGRAQWRLVDGNGKEQFLQPLACAEGKPVWYPLIPFGDFEYSDPASGEVFRFSVTQQYANEMAGHLKAGGNYGPHGIPIDEDNVHQPLLDGADAWLKDLDVREDGLWALVEPTEKGCPAVESRPYISPKFTIGEGVDPKYGLQNFIRSGAFVSQPWFWPQPGLTIAASMSTLPVEDVADQTQDGTDPLEGAARKDTLENPEGGIQMTPEELAALQQELEQAKTDKAALEAALAERDATVAEQAEQIETLTARAEQAEAAQADLATRIEAIETALAGKETEAAIAAEVNKLEQVRVSETIVPEQGDPFVEERALAPEYVMASALAVVLKTPEATEALNVILAANNYRPPTVSCGDKPALQPFKASAADPAGPQTDAEKLEAWLATDKRKAEVGRVMATGMSFEAAKRQVLGGS